MPTTQRNGLPLVIAAILCIGTAACADRSAQDMEIDGGAVQDTTPAPPSAGGTEPEPDGAAADADAFPPTRQDTILLEGMPEPITLELFESPESFSLPFVTYHPEDIEPQRVAPEEGEVVRFQANMGGVPEEDAVVGVFLHPEGTSEQEARALLQNVVRSYEESREPDIPQFPWAIEEYQVNDGSIVGRYALGQHSGRYFHVMITYPPEYGDGFGPRAAIVLDEWRWLDTRTGLTTE